MKLGKVPENHKFILADSNLDAPAKVYVKVLPQETYILRTSRPTCQLLLPERTAKFIPEDTEVILLDLAP